MEDRKDRSYFVAATAVSPDLKPTFSYRLQQQIVGSECIDTAWNEGFFILLLKKRSISRNGQLSGTPRVSPWGRSAIASRPDRRKSKGDDGLTLHVLDPILGSCSPEN